MTKKVKEVKVPKGNNLVLKQSTSKSQFFQLLFLGGILLILGGMLLYYFYNDSISKVSTQEKVSKESCFYNDVEYISGKTFSDDYNLCYCLEGKIKCSRTEESSNFTEADQVKFDNRYNISLEIPSSPNLKVDITPFGERTRENKMDIEIIDYNITEGVDFAWAGIRITVAHSGGENLNSYVRSHSLEYLGALRESSLEYDSTTIEKITKWGTDVYVYTDKYPTSTAPTEYSLYIFKRDYDIIFIEVYINNKAEQYREVLEPILDTLKF